VQFPEDAHFGGAPEEPAQHVDGQHEQLRGEQVSLPQAAAVPYGRARFAAAPLFLSKTSFYDTDLGIQPGSSFSVQNIFYDTDLGIHPRVDWADLACLWLDKGNEMVQLASPVKTIQKWIEIQFYYNTNTKLA
jgi:hypothetical protein